MVGISRLHLVNCPPHSHSLSFVFSLKTIVVLSYCRIVVDSSMYSTKTTSIVIPVTTQRFYYREAISFHVSMRALLKFALDFRFALTWINRAAKSKEVRWFLVYVANQNNRWRWFFLVNELTWKMSMSEVNQCEQLITRHNLCTSSTFMFGCCCCY